ALDVLPSLASADLSHLNFSWETGNSFGVFALPFAGGAVGLGRRRARHAPWLLLLSLLFASGWRTPLGALWLSLPFVRTLTSYPTRLVWIATVALAVLAGAGVDALLRMGSRRRVRVVAGLAVGGLLLVLANPPDEPSGFAALGGVSCLATALP